MDQLAVLNGVVDHLIFQNNENGYTVGILQVAKQKIAFKGTLPLVRAGHEVSLKGSWISHPKFGKQFKTTSYTVHTPTSPIGLKKYLASGMIKGIGPAYADKLVNYFGTKVLDIIDTDPQQLSKVPGIGQKRIDQIITGWQDQKQISTIMLFLQEKGISPAYAVKIYKKYGVNAQELVSQNPYRLADEVWGIGFAIADRIAQQMGFALNSPKRIRSGILFAIGQVIGQGHVYADLTVLKEQINILLGLDDQQAALVKMAFHELHEERKIALVSYDEKHYVTLIAHYATEKSIAEKLKKLMLHSSPVTIDHPLLTQLLIDHAQHNKIDLTPEQQNAIIGAFQQKVTIITGGPGTGKTTLIKTMLAMLDELKMNYKLAAPTGRAAKRMSQSTYRQANTLHRLLEFDVSSMGFSKNEHNALTLQFLIIDETSMLDIFLFNAVLKALPYHAHLVLIGDVDQLPSVGAGNVLKDLIKAQLPVTRLQFIFRQAQNSLIALNAHKIQQGEFFSTNIPEAKRDFIFIKQPEAETIETQLRSLMMDIIPKYNIPLTDTMVLTPMNKGIVGTFQLNHFLQTIVNPDTNKNSITYGSITFKEGDRVMQVRNNYDKLVFNGDIGTIQEIDTSALTIKVIIDDRIILYEHSEFDELILANAITIHKSQGSEYGAVIILMFMQHFTLLTRNLLYTAITRAKRLCICIGQPQAFAMAIKNNKIVDRVTFLSNYITTDLQCR